MKVRDVMTSDIAIASPDTTLEEIATMMKSEDAGAIPILEDDELLGIITDRDIVIRCIAEGEDPAELTADDILSESPEIVEPDTDAEDALEIMGRRQVRRLPVVEDGSLVGMVSLGDLAVKRGDLKDTGETLKDVSQGVKPSRRSAAPQAEPQAAGTIARNVTKNPKHSTGITNDLDEEERRQARVVSIRPDANALPRGQKKSGKREAS
jgi:CBS domain-containing protein